MKNGVFRRCDPRVLALLACLVWGGACSSQAPTEVSTNRDAGTGGSSNGDAGTVDSTNAGALVLQAYGGPSGMVAADVPLLEPGVGQQQTCKSPLVAGACQLTSCLNGGVGSPGRGYGNFGPISVSVGNTTIALDYKDTGYPTVYFPSSIMLEEGGVMTFSGGDGAGVPPFNVLAIIPGVPVITSPVPTAAGGAAIIDTSQDLTVTWMPISIGQVSFGIQGGSVDVGAVALSLTCTFEGASGSGVVPQSLLASMKEMSGASSTYGSLRSGLVKTVVINGLTIVTESAQSSPVTDHDFNVTLQ